MAPIIDGITSAAGGGGGMAIGLGEGLALGASLLGGLFGGGGGGDYETTITQPTLAPLPLQNEIMGAARGVYNQYVPWLYNPWRPIDYFQGVGVPGNYAPQFSQTGLPQYPVGGMGYMNDFTENPLMIAALAQAMAQQGGQGQPPPGGAGGQQGVAGLGIPQQGGQQAPMQGGAPQQQAAPSFRDQLAAQYGNDPATLDYLEGLYQTFGQQGSQGTAYGLPLPGPYGPAGNQAIDPAVGNPGQQQQAQTQQRTSGSSGSGQVPQAAAGGQPSYLGSGTNPYPMGVGGGQQSTNVGGGGVTYNQQLPPMGGVPAGAAPGTHTSPQGGTARQQQTVGPGTQNPYFNDPYGIWGPVDAPSPELSDAFLPDIFREPYIRSTQDAMNVSNYAQQALPQAGAFQQALYSPGMTPMEQAYLGASAQLGMRNLNNTQNRIEGMFENSASHGSLAPALFDATNQFNQQLNQMAGQMGTQRQTTAAQAMPFTFGFPLQAGQAAQQGAEGLHNMAQNAQLAGMPFVQSAFGSQPYAAPIAVSSPA